MLESLLIGCACWLPTGCCHVRSVGTTPPHWVCLSVADWVLLGVEDWYSSSLGVLADRVRRVGVAPPHWVCLPTE